MKNHDSHQSVWLVFYKKACGKPTITWSEAVDEALCFGWIDSKSVAIDEISHKQYFTKRKPKSTWSKINKDKVECLIDAKKMMPEGLKCVEIAKQNGSWTFLESIDALEIPLELEQIFKLHKGSKKKFQSLSPSKQKLLLYGLKVVKTVATKEKRIAEILEQLI